MDIHLDIQHGYPFGYPPYPYPYISKSGHGYPWISMDIHDIQSVRLPDVLYFFTAKKVGLSIYQQVEHAIFHVVMVLILFVRLYIN